VNKMTTTIGYDRHSVREPPGDYDPTAPLERAIRVPVGDVNKSDPLNRTVNKLRRESELYGALTGQDMVPHVPGHTARLDTTNWGTLAIMAQPCCHNIDPRTGMLKFVPVNEHLVAERKSKVSMDHYAYPQGAYGNTISRAENPVGITHNPGRDTRADMKSLVHHTCPREPWNKGRDDFMLQRGLRAGVHVKGAVPLVRHGAPDYAGYGTPPHTRRSLPNIIDRARPVHKLDHIGVMLDSSGVGHELHRSTPPEGRRQRKDLFETLHATSNPYTDKRPLGDRWMEQRGILAGARAKPAQQHISEVHTKVLMHADQLLLATPYGAATRKGETSYSHPLDYHKRADNY
jgi:hypothetical protein